MSQVTWVLESDVFPKSHEPVRAVLGSMGVRIIDWKDEWCSSGDYPALKDTPVVFHGSLGNAAMIAERLAWTPGSFCKTAAFCCSAWYETAHKWLLHRDWRILPAEEFVAHAPAICAELDGGDRLFVRPDSPLKPFSGRVVATCGITLESLDYGFYYDDARLPIVAAPVCDVGREWRFVVVKSQVVAGSAYDSSTRSALPETLISEAWRFARAVASELPPPDDVYILDICESNGELRLLELNPFSGADLYACVASDVVATVSEVACDIWASQYPNDLPTRQAHRPESSME